MQPIDADDENAAAGAGGLALARDDRFCRGVRHRLGLADGADRGLQRAQVDLGARHGGKEFVDPGVARLGGHRLELERGHAGARELALDDGAAVGDRLLDLLRLEPLPHLGPRAVAVHVAELGIEPVARRAALLHRDDLDPLPAREHVVERHHRAVDARAAAAVAQARVHRIGEIDRRRAARQIDHLALRREHVDRLGEQA